MSQKFDRYKDSYREEVTKSIGFIGQDVDFFTRAKTRSLLDVAREGLGDPKNMEVLDVGCGVGETDRLLAGSFSSLDGVDVSQGAIEAASTTNPWARYASYDGTTLPYESESFDLTFTICVMHHVPPEKWADFTREMARVTRSGGLVVVYEHNPLNPLTRLAVNRCEFDDDAVLLRMSRTKELLEGALLEISSARFILFSPWRLKGFDRIEPRLGKLPLGAQYYVAGRRSGAVTPE